MSDKFETSKESGMHGLLNSLVGDWVGTAKTWFEPDVVADESPVRGSIRTILDGRFVLYEYQGAFGGKSLEGICIYGYHLALGKFQSVWLDSFHNGSAMMFSEAQKGANKIDVLGSYAYVTPELEQHWGWRTQLDQRGDDELVITAYNISPEGVEVKATETVLQRIGSTPNN